MAHGTRNITQQAIRQYGEDYRTLLLALRDGHFDITSAHNLHTLNAELSSLIHHPAKCFVSTM